MMLPDGTGVAQQPRLFRRRTLSVVLLSALLGLAAWYFVAIRRPSDDQLICEARYVAGKFFRPTSTWSPKYRVDHPDSDRWLVHGETEGDTGSGKPALHTWTAMLQRISIGRVECVELHIDGRQVLKLDPEFLKSPNSAYHSGPRRQCSGR